MIASGPGLRSLIPSDPISDPVQQHLKVDALSDLVCEYLPQRAPDRFKSSIPIAPARWSVQQANLDEMLLKADLPVRLGTDDDPERFSGILIGGDRDTIDVVIEGSGYVFDRDDPLLHIDINHEEVSPDEVFDSDRDFTVSMPPRRIVDAFDAHEASVGAERARLGAAHELA